MQTGFQYFHPGLKFLFVCLASLFFSCENDGTGFTGTGTFESLGGFDEIVIVADKNNLDQYLKSSLLQTFKATFDILPQDEPLFDTRVIGYPDFEKIFKRFRTIILVADLSDNTAITEFVVAQLGEENTAKALNNPSFFYAVKKNIWARPQTVIFLFSPSKEQLISRIQNGAEKAVELAQESELDKYRSNIYLPGINQSLTKTLLDDALIRLNIPKDYVLAQKEADFFWLRKITDTHDHHLMISILPDEGETPNPVQWRDELGRQYVSTKIEGSYMLSDTILPFVARTLTVNGYPVIEKKGLWRMENDFMGGPFMTYLITDELNDRYILIDGFVYVPGDKNKPQLRSVEALMREFGK